MMKATALEAQEGGEESTRATVTNPVTPPGSISLEQSPVRMPSSWPSSKKIFIAATVLLMNFNVTLGSSLPSGASDSLAAAFGVHSKFQIPLPVAIFLIGYILGPIVFAPMSESFGRRPVFLSSFAIYTAFTLGCALAPNWPTFLFFRFMVGCGAAAPQTVSGGLFSDLYPDLGPRGRAVTALGLTSNVGPLVGPIISGFTSTSHWQWQFWAALLLAGVNWPPLLMMPETFGPVLNARAIKLHAEKADEQQPRGNGEAIKGTKGGMIKWKTLSLRVLARPILILREPLVFFTDLFILYQYIIYFLYFGTYRIVFKGTYGLSDGQSALMFIPVGIGAVFAIGIFLAWDAYYKAALRAGKAWSQREEYRRLPLACLGGPLFAISEFWLGWSARPSIHWSVPALSGLPLGIGIDLTFLALNNYLTDSYGVYSASALASSVLTRNVVAAVLIPFATYPLYENLGTSWACTLLGFLCVALVPIPFGFLKWGPRMRERSPFCQKLTKMREEGEEGGGLPMKSGLGPADGR